MGNNKQEYCNTDHHTLQQAKDRLHALLTSTMMGNVEYILDKSLEESKNKLTTLSNARDQLDNQKKITTSKKAERRRLTYLLEKAKGNLIGSFQEELHYQVNSTDAKKRIKKDTKGQLIQFLGQNELYTPRSDDWVEPAIPISVLQSIAKPTLENLQSVCELMSKSSRASQEEDQATVALEECEKKEYIDSQQTYTRRMADTNDIYLALVDLELDCENIKEEGNIMDYERKARVPSALHQKRVNNLKDKLEDHQNQIRDIIDTGQPTQDSLNQVYGRIGEAKKFISLYNNKYPHYWEERVLDTMLTKLEYTVKIATNKYHELQDLGDKI